MQRTDVIRVLGILKTAYPRFYANVTKEDANEAVNLWSDMFSQEDVETVIIAVKNLINTLQFPPTIADVKNELYKLYQGEEKPDVELWNELKGALRQGIYYSAEIFPKLSNELQLFLGNPASLKELAMMDVENIDTVQKGIFLKQMPIIKQREQEKKMMLPDRREFIENLAEKMNSRRYLGE